VDGKRVLAQGAQLDVQAARHRSHLPWQPDKIGLRLPGRVGQGRSSCLASGQTVLDCGRQLTIP
jgi:hypothetical protein